MRLARAGYVMIAIALLVLPACSDGGSNATAQSSAPPDIDATCADLATWAASVQRAFVDLQRVGQFDATDTAGAQDQLKRLSAELASADQATATLIDGLNARSAPSILGEDVKKALVDTLNKLRALASTTRRELDAFDVKTATKEQSDKLRAALDALRNSVTESLTGLAPLLTSNSELRRALENSPRCKQLGTQLFSSR